MLSAIKLLSNGKVGAYGTCDDDTNKHEVKPWFQNPFDPDIDVFFVICPSNQVQHHLYVYTFNPLHHLSFLFEQFEIEVCEDYQ